MEKMMNLAALLAITTQMLGIGGAAALTPPNGLQVLTETAMHNQWTIDGVVCEAWVPKVSERAVRALLHALALEDAPGGVYQPTEDTTVKIRYTDGELVVQVTSKSLAEAEAYYQSLSRWMARYGQGRFAGATVLCQIPEALSVEVCQCVVAEAMTQWPAQLVSATEEGRVTSCAYYVPGVRPVLQVAGEKMNVNVACVREETKTRLYLGTPVIYQQY